MMFQTSNKKMKFLPIQLVSTSCSERSCNDLIHYPKSYQAGDSFVPYDPISSNWTLILPYNPILSQMIYPILSHNIPMHLILSKMIPRVSHMIPIHIIPYRTFICDVFAVDVSLTDSTFSPLSTLSSALRGAATGALGHLEAVAFGLAVAGNVLKNPPVGRSE